ncbi:MAG: hypothetical protein GC145_05995 [Caulobacter sp.]|nr:hypothetical protein [Caulobacter sp.]
MRTTLAAAALVGTAALASPGLAATVRDCDGYTDSAANIVVPWEENSRTFYNGQVRVAVLDTGGEPACCSAHLLILFYNEPEDEPGGMVCKLVSDTGTSGFAGIDAASINSRYDPARGLLLSFRYAVFPADGDGARTVPGTAAVRINLARGTVTAQ